MFVGMFDSVMLLVLFGFIVKVMLVELVLVLLMVDVVELDVDFE